MGMGTDTRAQRTDWPAPHDRPREKLARHGAAALGDNELLALVLGPGRPGQSALALASAVLALDDGIRGLSRTSFERLRHVSGLGIARAARIVAAVELGRRSLTPADERRPQFLSPRELAAYLVPRYGARPVEHFGVVLLDARNRLIRIAPLSVGTVDGTVVHPRDVFREATLSGAAGVVLFHNHPSGDPMPSSDDGSVTRRLVAAGKLMGIEVLDHVILTEAGYYSYKESHLL